MTTTVYHLDWKVAADLRDLASERELLCDEGNIDRAFSRAMTGTVSPAILDLFMNGHYHKVATVATDDLDSAYQLTNSIHDGWWNNHGTWTRAGPLAGPVVDHGRRGCWATCSAPRTAYGTSLPRWASPS
jgi:hypothetical protein